MSNMMCNCKLGFSKQSLDLLAHMPEVEEEEVISWFSNVRGVSIGGGHIIEYLDYLKNKDD